MYMSIKIYIYILMKVKILHCFGPPSPSKTRLLFFYTLAIFAEQESSTWEEIFLSCLSWRYCAGDTN